MDILKSVFFVILSILIIGLSTRSILRNIDWKKRNDLAKQYNLSTDLKERLRILREINVIDNQLHSHIIRSEALDKEREKIDKLYKQMSEYKD